MRRLLLTGALVLGATPLLAQASTFGIRGLGFPNQPYSAHARGLGGSSSLFDAESGMNPATLGTLHTLTAGITTLPSWTAVESPAGTGSVRGMRFPLIAAGGPIPGSRFAIGISASSYTIRDFSQAFVDTLTVRGASEEVHDTLSGRGGISDLRLAVAWRATPTLDLGGSIHALTGTDRAALVRHFTDTVSYATASESTELSYAGFGIDLGARARLGPTLDLAVIARSDGNVTVQRDSLNDKYPVDLPYTFGAGLRYRPTATLTVTGQGIFKTWSGANSDLLLQGGTGSRNVWDLSAGAELIRDPSRPFDLPLRVGARYADLPFPFTAGDAPKEWALSVGTGKLFAKGMGGFDAALERVWRSEAGGFSERAWLLTISVTVRPYFQPTPGGR
ncbi:MAG TPA: hypothetical protein VFI39_01095 [Gemmatimonadales bacterium]|nr:hypothetical protein [Gemmatimonadales bacterium]